MQTDIAACYKLYVYVHFIGKFVAIAKDNLFEWGLFDIDAI